MILLAIRYRILLIFPISTIYFRFIISGFYQCHYQHFQHFIYPAQTNRYIAKFSYFMTLINLLYCKLTYIRIINSICTYHIKNLPNLVQYRKRQISWRILFYLILSWYLSSSLKSSSIFVENPYSDSFEIIKQNLLCQIHLNHFAIHAFGIKLIN